MTLCITLAQCLSRAPGSGRGASQAAFPRGAWERSMVGPRASMRCPSGCIIEVGWVLNKGKESGNANGYCEVV